MKIGFCVTSTLPELISLNLCYSGHVQNTQRVKISMNGFVMGALKMLNLELG